MECFESAVPAIFLSIAPTFFKVIPLILTLAPNIPFVAISTYRISIFRTEFFFFFLYSYDTPPPLKNGVVYMYILKGSQNVLLKL